MIQGFPTPSKYKVLVRCNTFNQSKYIEDTLHGFTMQQTNFPFLVYVIDDASTDGEQDVLRRWIDTHCNHEDIKVYDNDLAIILMSKDKDNENCIYAIHLLKKNLFMKPEKQELHKIWRSQCEYEASCEGDDYWIDPLKLQKQADYLDSHPECGVVGSTKRSYIQKDGKFIEDPKTESYTDFKTTLLKGRFNCGTCTIMYRIAAMDGYHELVAEESKKWKMGDLPQWLYIMSKYTAYRFEEPMAVYRVLQESASHSTSYIKAKQFNQSAYKIQRFFAEKFEPSLLSEIENAVNKNFFYTALAYKQKEEMWYYAKRSKLTFVDYLRIVKAYLF